jgi:hypothetical protein
MTDKPKTTLKPLYTCQEELRQLPVKKIYKDKEILEKLKRVRDDSLDWLVNVAELRNTAGSATALMLVEKTISLLADVEDRASHDTGTKNIKLTFAKPETPIEEVEESSESEDDSVKTA